VVPCRQGILSASVLSRASGILPPEVLTEVDKFIKENKQWGYTTREEFIRDTIRFGIRRLSKDNVCIEMPRERFVRLGEAIKAMDLPYRSAEDFIEAQVKDVIERSEKRKNASKA
jgi:hypothetical protein